MTRQFAIRDLASGETIARYTINDPNLPAGDLGDCRLYRHVEEKFVPANLSQYQTEAVLRINDLVRKAIRLFLDDLPYQADVLRDKVSEAVAYKQAGYPADASPYPLLKAIADRRGLGYQAVADALIAKGQEVKQLKQALEAARLGGIADVEAAATVSAVDAAEQASFVEIGTIMSNAGYVLA